MKTTSFRFAAVLLVSALSAGAIPRPDIPDGSAAREPDLLDAYQRRTLQLELVKLQREIVAARREAAASEELEPLRAALAEAKLGGDATNVLAKQAALSDATETILYRDETIPPKIKRLQEVGRLLEYDNRREKQDRAKHPPRLPPAVVVPPAATNAADGAEAAR